MSGNFAFNGNNTQEILAKTLEGAYSINDKKWKNVSQKAKDLVNALLENEVQDRISLDDALKHEWFQDFDALAGGYSPRKLTAAKKKMVSSVVHSPTVPDCE